MEREIVLTGVGGQGIQLAARTIAEAAIAEGFRVQLFASYGGMMRGGNSDSYLVIADTDITSPPVVGAAWASVVMHHEHAAGVWPKMRDGSLSMVNTSVVEPTCRPDSPRCDVAEVPALDMANDVGSAMAASMVLVGALVARTGLVGADALLDTAERVLPSYRAKAAATNRLAMEAGLGCGPVTHPAWETATVAS